MQLDTKVEIKFSKSEIKSILRVESLIFQWEKYILQRLNCTYKLKMKQHIKYISWKKSMRHGVKSKISKIEFQLFPK